MYPERIPGRCGAWKLPTALSIKSRARYVLLHHPIQDTDVWLGTAPVNIVCLRTKAGPVSRLLTYPTKRESTAFSAAELDPCPYCGTLVLLASKIIGSS